MTTVLATKLFIPPLRPEAIARPRLLATLRRGAQRKVTLVSAAAGFGKTTLVSQWMHSQDRPVAWLSLDAGDNDPARFLMGVVAALQTVAPAIGQGLVTGLQSPQPPSPEALLTGLLNDITAYGQPLVMVLDDYHVIEAQAVHQALAFLLEHLPATVHLVIATREDPPLPLGRLRAHHHLTELRIADLRFTHAEAAAFLADLDLPDEAIDALEHRTEGWIAGLQMAALSLQGHEDVAGFIESFTGSHRFVLDYLLEEVLAHLPPHIERFLLETSILERLCTPLCDAVVEDVPAQETLSYLEQSNLFLIPLDEERRWYRYHRLFADLLRQRLGPDTANLHQRASRWYEEEGYDLEAFHHATAAGDIERATRLLVGEWTPLHFRGGMADVLPWLEGLPPSVLDAYPTLWVMYASALSISGQGGRVEPALQAAEAAIERTDPGPHTDNLIGHIAAIRAVMAVGRQDVDTIIEQSERALAYLHPDNHSVRTATTWKLGIAYQFRGDHEAARQAFTEAVTISQASGNTLVQILALTGLGHLQEAAYHLHRAEEIYRQIVELAGDPPTPLACEAYLGLGHIRYEWDDIEAAQRHGTLALQLGHMFNTIDTAISAGILLARVHLAQDDIPQALAALTDAEQFARRHRFERRLPDIAAMRARIALAQGNLAEAVRLTDAHDISRARVHLAQGDPTAALDLLEPLRDQPDDRLRMLVLLALAYHAEGATNEALSTLGEALTLAQPGGYIRTFADEGPPMADLLRRADLMPAYVERLLAAFDEQPLLDPLSEREMEVLHLIAEGLSNQAIGERLFIALDTVKGHTRRIYRKLDVNRRTEAVARARELGLL